MAQNYQQIASVTPSAEEGSYVYSITPTIENGLAAITSADELVLIDKSHLSASSRLKLQQTLQGLTCLAQPSEQHQAHTLLCSARDGTVAIYDVRSQSKTGQLKTDRAVTALACRGNNIAIGTELSHHQAVVSLWDRRKLQQVWQNSENNDDITALDFHPSAERLLLSGGDDGVVSIFDTSISEDDDSLYQAINHGPIHKAGFLGDSRFYALSADQNLAIHSLSTPDDNEAPPPTLIGDLRPLVPCEYVIGLVKHGTTYAVAAGTNIDNPRIELIELINLSDTAGGIQGLGLSLGNKQTLPGAHGEEVVRSIVVEEDNNVIFTAGEDGQIRAFRASGSAASTPAKTAKFKKGAEARYKPY